MLAALEISTGRLWLLGAIAGLTIFLGLPLGRLRSPAPRLRAALNAVSIGILLFLLVEVVGKANETVEHSLVGALDHGASWWRFAGYATVFAVGLAAGLVGLAYYDRWIEMRSRPFGPGAAHVDELSRPIVANWSPAKRLAMLIAVGIGLHNFSEGLTIGQSAAKGEIALALTLIIGFGLHNATEGFGIVGPMAAAGERPSWRFLTVAGLVGGAPTFLGTVVGRSFVNDTLFLSFLALAGGSILYVVVQLLKVAAKQGLPEIVMWGILIGLILGFGTDYVLVAAGA
jgi:ZIP family zinc transporter